MTVPRASLLPLVLLVLLLLRGVEGFRGAGLGLHAQRSSRRLTSFLGALVEREVVLVGGAGQTADVQSALAALKKLRPQVRVVEHVPGVDGLMWTLHAAGGENMQLDCTALEESYLGGKKLSTEETAGRWNDVMRQRVTVLGQHGSSDKQEAVNLGDGGALQAELNAALAAVHRASFMSRSLQKGFLSVSKDDMSPVTIADFAVQALVVDVLSRAFPGDKFIAEEDSEALRSDPAIRGAVLSALQAATSSAWTEERLYSTVDRGSFSGSAPRVWVLDPVDGTKGFMRGQHYCIALALLINGKPQLSVMGCPNVNLNRVLEPEVTLARGGKVSDIDECFGVADAAPAAGNSPGELLRVHSLSAGSVFYAAQGRGAWARSLSMPLEAGHEVTVSGVRESASAALCEATEAGYGDREVTQGVFKRLGLTRDFLRLDGQCKYCVVGSGAAEGNLRLPSPGYREKIWDAAPGAHFITEAGGRVTDLEGRELDFGEGRVLAARVEGIVSSNTLLHAELLAAVAEARALKAKKG